MIKLRCRTNQIRSNRYCRVLIAAQRATRHNLIMRAEHLAPVLDHLALLDRLSRRLRAYYKGKLARIGRGAAEAEDLVQEAILAIHLKRHIYAPAEPLTPWVHAIARYQLIEQL